MDTPLRKHMTKPHSEFGGTAGNLFIMGFSHVLVYYLWISLTYYQGGLVLPASLSDLGPFCDRMWSHLSTGAALTWAGVAIYGGFIAFQALLAWFVPGLHVKGLPVPSLGNRQLTYVCNGIGCWYITLGTAFFLQVSGLFPLTLLIDHLGSIITTGVLWANGMAVWMFLAHKPAQASVTDFFMGVALNPRVGRIDVKMFSEIRVPWILLFFLTLSATAKQVQLQGEISGSMALMILAHGLYTNACMKGEECIPTTWDIFHEKFGWMLIFWNYIGVPFVYCFQSFYILANNPQLPTPFLAFLFVLLGGAYWVWDTANSQKNRFRMQQRGTFVQRKTFPQLPWGTLKNPSYILTKSGSQLLTDGWYKYGRKIHYTADSVMALTWAMSCGFAGVLPYFYPLFFMSMIAHRYLRDRERCKEKYGADWDTYCKRVPYVFIPYVY